MGLIRETNEQEGKLAMLEEGAHNFVPLLMKIEVRSVLSRPRVPVAGVRKISFLSMEMGMYPGSSGGRFVLHEMVCFLPVPLGFVPQRLKRGAKARGNGCFREAFSELCGGHCVFGVLRNATRKRVASKRSTPPNQRSNVATRSCEYRTANAAAKEIFSTIAAIISNR